MKPKILILILTIVFSLSAFAGNINEEEAGQVAKNFYYENTLILQSKIIFSETKTISEEDISLFYIFNIENNKGFVIISAQDNVVPILGYSNIGTFSYENMQPALENWIQNYENQIIVAKEKDIQATQKISNLWKNYNVIPINFTATAKGNQSIRNR